MKLLFAHDHRFSQIDDEYYSSGGLPQHVWNRYLNHFKNLVVIGRSLSEKNKDKLTLSSHKNVDFNLLNYLENPINAYRFKSRMSKDIKAIIIKNEIDAAVVRLPSEIGYATIDVCRELNLPYLVEVVGCTYDAINNYKFSPWYNYKNVIVKILAPVAYQRMRKYVRASKYTIYVTQYFLQNRYPVSDDAMTAYASNVELPNFDSSVLEKHISLLKENKRQLSFGMIGNTDVPYKGYDISLKALALIKDRIPDFKLYIVGRGEGTEVLKLAQILNVADNLVLLGKFESGEPIFNFLDGLDLYLHPSRQEGLPRSLIEAMGRGCPALGSTTAGIPELLSEEYLHNTGDYKKLAEQIVQLVNSQDKLIKAALLNFKKSKDYVIDILAQRRYKFFDEFYKEVEKSLNR